MSASVPETGAAQTPQGTPETPAKPGSPADMPQTKPGAPADKPDTEAKFTQADIDRIVAARVGPLQTKAAEYDKLIDSQKTEAQRQADNLARLEAENTSLKAVQARRQAGEAAKLPVEALDLITGTTPEEISASVEKVQALITTISGPQTPKPNPLQGAANTNPGSDEDWLRAGFARH